MAENELRQIKDWPKGGPLDEYRKRASFDWKKMKLFLEDIDVINFRVRIEFSPIRFDFNLPTLLGQFQEEVFKTLGKDPLFMGNYSYSFLSIGSNSSMIQDSVFLFSSVERLVA